MTSSDLYILRAECLKLLQYYIDKASQLLKIHAESSQMRYFLFALKGNRESIKDENLSKENLIKYINTLMEIQEKEEGHDRLHELRKELQEELTLFKLRYDLD